MSLPYFPMYPTDFEAKTSHLTLEEDGAYNRLLRLMWMTPGCSLPDDDAWIMRRMRVDADTYKRVVLVVIEEFCERENGRVSNAKLNRIFASTSEAHEKRVSAGAKGGKAKALKTNDKGPSNAIAKPKQPEPEPEPELIKRETSVSLVHRSPFSAKDFTDFWDAYPHRNGKKNRKGAEAAFARAVKSGVTVAEIAAGVEAMRRDPDVVRGYARDPTTWLNQRGWADEHQTTNGTRNEHRTGYPQQSTNGRKNGVDPALEQIARLAGLGAASGHGGR